METADLFGRKIESLFGIIAVVLFVFLLLTIRDYISLPEVHYSFQTKECVKVIKDGKERDCTEIPEKYKHVWAQ